MVAVAKKTERIELRVSSEEKAILMRAAAAEHIDVTAFVKRAALPAAERRLAEMERIRLSARDAEKMLALLEDPPAPTAALAAAARAKRGRA